MGALFENGATAEFSPCGKYRYTLTRSWGDGRRCVFVMLNPSTADAEKLDPTIRRCVRFAKREGCGSILVLNLYAFRSTDPKGLPDDGWEATGGDTHGNYLWDELVERNHRDLVIVAWGVSDKHDVAPEFYDQFLRHRAPVYCLGMTKDGHPRHPLYVKADKELDVWAPEAVKQRSKQ